jgi:hypothetical protein
LRVNPLLDSAVLDIGASASVEDERLRFAELLTEALASIPQVSEFILLVGLFSAI